MPTRETILTINGGSSSLKFAVFRTAGANLNLLARGRVERIGAPGSRLQLSAGSPISFVDARCRAPTATAALDVALRTLTDAQVPSPTLIGHRLVHGGPRHVNHVRLTPRIRRDLAEAESFAPLHLPAELALIDALAARFPEARQVACFDTAFHAALPERSRRFPLPAAFLKGGLHRYGFHGLSYESLVRTLGARSRGKIVLAHVGSGVSLAAVIDGRPVDTTMGLTPAGGVMMGSRPGDLDPGVLIHWLRTHRGNVDRLEELIEGCSGLRGVGGNSDIRVLLRQRRRSTRARLAIEMFCYHLRRCIAAMAASLGGIDALVFTGGIGENSPPIRARICRPLKFLGVQLDRARNAGSQEVISPPRAQCIVRVLRTDEEKIIARHAWRLGCGRDQAATRSSTRSKPKAR